MALYIQIRKISETDLEAVYEYLPDADESRVGQLQIDKRNGEVREMKPSPGDEQKLVYSRAARKVSQHYQKAEYPSITSWAS
jgi:hypothetical protein